MCSPHFMLIEGIEMLSVVRNIDDSHSFTAKLIASTCLLLISKLGLTFYKNLNVWITDSNN